MRRFKYTGRLFLKLIRDENDPDKVYAIIKGRKRHIALEETLFVLGFDHSDPKYISHEEFEKIIEGEMIIYKKEDKDKINKK